MVQTSSLTAASPLTAELPLPHDGVCEGLEQMVQERKVRACVVTFICMCRYAGSWGNGDLFHALFCALHALNDVPARGLGLSVYLHMG